MRKIAFTDIHGCNRSFGALLDRVAPVSGDQLYFLGDYIDRGPDAKGVIDRIWELEKQGFDVQCLLGNHEVMFLESFLDEQSKMFWLVNGGQAVLDVFGAGQPQDIPAEYVNWMMDLHLYLQVDDYILVHAGLGFKTVDPLENHDSMLWIRRWYDSIDYDWLGDRIILHGHTPLPRDEISEQLRLLEHQQYLDIDAGCAHKGKRPGLGDLCAFDMTNRRLYFQENLDF